ncbi:MAG: MoaD/ThiS family protein [Rhodothermaceae bacterium]|nr:MoaD/ThiS family protein [Rhodothermaceae bacterium]MYG68737.1 MoaD/ThiS family protein [Rhodothermaceae bacterium]MYJ45840.1 MoaD/ThiS family protein [Rhodothermaceae bacterium]
MPSFKIQLYSILKSKLQADSVDLETQPGITVSEFLDLACEQYPTMAPYRSVMRLAVNQAYSRDSSIIQDGDEIAIITPVSGG